MVVSDVVCATERNLDELQLDHHVYLYHHPNGEMFIKILGFNLAGFGLETTGSPGVVSFYVQKFDSQTLL